MLLVVGNREDFVSDNPDEELAQIHITPIGESFAIEPQAVGGAHGTFAYEWVDEGTVVVGGGQIGKPGNTLVLAEGEDGTDCTRDISANTGYIVYGENVLTNDDDFDLIITAERPETSVQGDANGDGGVDVADYTYILNLMADEQFDVRGDVNGDGQVDVADATFVLNIMADQ